MLTRVLPGGMIVAAALTMPEFSVGAGDIGRGPEPVDPPEPAARPGSARTQRLVSSAAPTHPKLAGVRYAAVIDLGTDTAPTAAEAVPSHAAFTQAFAAPGFAAASVAGAVAPPAAPLAAPVERAPAIAPQPVADVPQMPPALAAAASAAIPADLEAAPERAAEPLAAPSKPNVAEADAMAFANLLPEERTALPAPAGTGARPAAAPVSAPASPAAIQPASRPASAPAAAAAPAPLPAPARSAARAAPASPGAQPAPRGIIDQVTPARIAAARAAPAPAPASVPATAPARAAPPSAPPSALPSASASAPKAVALAAIAPAAQPAPAPAPAPAAAAVAPRQAPALTAPPAGVAAAPPIADLAFKSRLLTRIDGRASGQVDFQQTPAGLKVRLGSVAEVLADRLPADDLALIRGSSSANAWFSLAELQAQGIPISYDPVYDEFNIGREDTRPKAARKVHIDQISTPERIGTGGVEATAMDQIPRR
jgi:hypothetical protein